MSFATLLTQTNAIIFILLFARVSGVMAFFPFFSHTSVPNTMKAAIAFFLVVVLFPIASLGVSPESLTQLFLAMMMEFALGLIAALALQLVFGAIGIAGMQISMVMGFSMASAFDPATQSNSPIISRFLTLLAILVLLSFDGHHLMLLFLSNSVDHLQLGMFYPHEYLLRYLSSAFSHMFVIGFLISFPIVAISILSDVIFGMLMKTMPQFNLLVIGFPIKIFLSVMVIIAVLGAMMGIFKKEFVEVFYFLKRLYL